MSISPDEEMSISPDELVLPETVAAELGIKTDTLTGWRSTGRGPPFFKVGRRVLYRRKDFSAWLGMQRRKPATAEARRAAADARS